MNKNNWRFIRKSDLEPFTFGEYGEVSDWWKRTSVYAHFCEFIPHTSNGYCYTFEKKEGKWYLTHCDYVVSEQQREERQLQREKIKRERKQLEIMSKTYDLEEHNKSAYIALKHELRNEIRKYFEKSEKIPTFNQLNGRKYRYKNIFNVSYKNLGDGWTETRKKITHVSGTDNDGFIFDAISVKVPTLKIENFPVMTEANINDLTIDFARGTTTVKIKKGNVTFLENQPDYDLTAKISNAILSKSLRNGKYEIKYQYSNIMGSENTIIDSNFISTNAGRKIILWTGGIGLVVLLVVLGSGE